MRTEQPPISQEQWNRNRDQMAKELEEKRNYETHCEYSGLPSVSSYQDQPLKEMEIKNPSRNEKGLDRKSTRLNSSHRT